MRKTRESTRIKVATIRDGFSMPADEHAMIGEIQLSLMRKGIGVNKSQILRAAVRLLYELPHKERAEFISSIPQLKAGRPPKNQDE